jgi:predicted enzyme related to lactoylglutathione lyase
MSEEKNCPKPGEFSWNELIASDEAAQKEFYTGLFGWTADAFGNGEKPYTLFKKGDTMVGGMMKSPKAGTPSHWLAYVSVEDVDSVAARAKSLGGKIIVEPVDIPDVGRIAVLLDPQGAAIGLYKSEM